MLNQYSINTWCNTKQHYIKLRYYMTTNINKEQLCSFALKHTDVKFKENKKCFHVAGKLLRVLVS